MLCGKLNATTYGVEEKKKLEITYVKNYLLTVLLFA
jgi:hypothetical protein